MIHRYSKRSDDVFVLRARRRVMLFVVLVALVLASVVTSLALGQYYVPLRDLLTILTQPDSSSLMHNVIWEIRLPRIVLGLLVGACLGVAGTLMQAVFANPLAEPSIIGVTSGAGVGAAAVIVFNVGFLGTFTVPAAAFLSAVVVTVIIYQLARHQGKVAIVNLILTGIAINAVCNALISFLVYLAPASNREEIVFWQMGSLNGAQWKHVWVVAPVALVGIVISSQIGKQLDVLALGERAAGHTGINVGRLRIIAIAASTILTAAAVSFAGLIGFVGLIVPHLLRSISGPENRLLLPASALAGAVLIACADVAARTMIPFADLPIGIFTALVGGSTFFVLLRRMLKKGSVH
ncbi:FecCD family ABC transporter permease [Corynebacterium diphtheriae]|uniref:FecCD family ABC transporter permease n=1 Tax=Corynebacterium diphtheriae TaxID=1717 RepID=UPI00064C7DB6|nr:iron ABC transporter permease [Corynebacterium diphtheriae]OWN08225.1 ABC transporter permease [Corynebacterium belfantii]KLN41609.1 iron ABC transporter permease [Corynebacterium diphtheriae bv. gravis str. ISS 4060]MBG9263258.1 iron ABC transporter permease [Corynebacterium diphtheriae bv. gravis]OWM45452.1 ABC transporter permease [Corynebacterium diphtheriae]OWM53765.1 ABC transporter permease [Corynebacterium diphtheriae]